MDNKMVSIVAVIILIVAAVGVGAYFLLKDDDKGGNSYETVTDAAGNSIKLDSAPERIVTTTVTATEDICDLGMRSALVGVSLDSHVYDVSTKVNGLDLTFEYPSTIEKDIEDGKLASVGKSTKWTAETVAACNPDLVIMDYNQISSDDSRMKQLQSLGITCVVLYSENGWDKINENITMLGNILAKQDRAKEITDATIAADKMIMEKFSGQKSMKVAHICYCFGSYYIYNESGPINVAISLGCTNAIPTTKSFATITPEDIAAANPDYIIFDDMATNLVWSDVIASWKSDAVMGEIPAIKNDQFSCMEFQPFQATSYTTVHYIQGEGILATMLYPKVVDSSIPQIVTSADWISYLSWMDE